MEKKMYSLYKEGKHVGDYTSTEIINFFGIKPKSFYTYVTTGFLYKKKYKIQKKEDELELEYICKEWDRWRKLLNPNANESKVV